MTLSGHQSTRMARVNDMLNGTERKIVNPDTLAPPTGSPDTPFELPTEPQERADLRNTLAETRKIVLGAAGRKREDALRLVDAIDAKVK